ncbi:MAG: carbamoyl phosphate synthase small subunit [Oscillospiraceae bacterium]|nr:carbamoyl phosphate synthase small subunit [Oscillospiraceae bacterium]
MLNKAYLMLENGTVFEGESFGLKAEAAGGIVFATGMTGYLETLTDPSYYGQIILQTFPLIGNYGVIPDDFESESIAALGYIVKYPCENPSNFRSEGTLDCWLRERGIAGLCGIDTRALTKIIREHGTMNGKISQTPPGEADRAEAAAYCVSGAVAAVSSKSAQISGSGRYRIALMDFGAKRGIAEALKNMGCEIYLFPHDTPANKILKIKPDGIMLSNGPGDPADSANVPIVKTIAELMKSGVPVFGICLGHQLMALANGYKTRKLKFGHRGVNQPVKDTAAGRVYITSQNHGYEVIADNSSFINVNDGSCEGLDYGHAFSVQFHPEARGGPLDTGFLFERFMERITEYATR